jgi:hypothetical protein
MKIGEKAEFRDENLLPSPLVAKTLCANLREDSHSRCIGRDRFDSMTF